MCLDLEKGAELQTATEDITVYKRIMKYPVITKLKSGMPFKGVICNIKCEGKISIENNRVFFCTDGYDLSGRRCADKQGYTNSWEFDSNVNLSKTTINEIAIITIDVTPYRRMPIEIGETYHSQLERNDGEVEVGLHSFASAEDAKNDGGGIVVKCVIPKGSKYYIGTYHDNVSYASDTLKYVEVI